MIPDAAVELMQRSGTTPPSKDDSASSQNLQWEESVPLSDWQIVPSGEAARLRGSGWSAGRQQPEPGNGIPSHCPVAPA
jgi:hypothetical protein